VTHSRRHFLQRGAAFTLGFGGLALLSGPAIAAQVRRGRAGYGPLKSDPLGLLDLPEGFSYRVISREGEEMSDGLLVPGKHDGMAAFPGTRGKTILVRNHEIEHDWLQHSPFGPKNERLSLIDPARIYDRGHGKLPGLGGTTTLVYDTATGKLDKHFLSLVGTRDNCAGGPTPWGSWLSCEESTVTKADGFEQNHGFVFEVPSAGEGLVTPQPLLAMGRFRHEAVAVDPVSGCIYETEGLLDGCIYRFLPKERQRLNAGGALQALMLRGLHNFDTKNHADKPAAKVGEKFPVRWVALDDVNSPNDDLRKQAQHKGAARFARAEGMWFGDGVVYFACTSGGRTETGQIWKYTPGEREGHDDEAGGVLELIFEPNDTAIANNADNVTVAPWGDLIVCEDGAKLNGLIGVTPAGVPYRIALNRLNESETAGTTFSPDGSTLFVNIQDPGMTLAIKGPWRG